MNKYQKGLTLIEILGALAISAIMLVGLTAIVDSSLEDTKGQQAALYQALVVNAATQYIQVNYSTLLGSASATTPIVVTRADLTPPAGTPYLSANVAATNIYGQTPCVLILKSNPGKLDALVVTYQGQVIQDMDLSNIAANSGQGGGYISSAKPTVAQGAAWALDSPTLAHFQSAPCLTGTPSDGGHLASAIFFDGPGQLSTDFLYRDAIPGHLELNTMNTPIVLSSVQVENAACTTGGAVSTDLNGAVLSCQLGTWQKQQGHWKDPVPDFASLPTTENVDGDVRMELTDNRAFVWRAASSSWIALAVDEKGNLAVPTTMTAKNVQLTDTETINTPCSTPGLVAHDANGILLSCQSGVWNDQFSFTVDFTETNCSVIMPSAFTSDPRCSNIYGGGYTYDSSVDTTYTIINRVVTPSRNGMIMLAYSAQMNRGLAGCVTPGCPRGQIMINATICDNDTGLDIGQAFVQSTSLTNDSAGINTTLVQAVKKNITGYTVKLTTGWSLFNGTDGFYNRSTEQINGGAIIDLTPIDVAWTLTLMD